MSKKILPKNGKFIITQRATREFQFNLKTPEGELILMSSGFPEKTECLHCIDIVRKNAESEMNFEKKISESQRNFFILKTAKSGDLCRSQQYSTEEYLNEGIHLVQSVAPIAEIIDLTV
ncbi:hypothetical protein ASG01_04640 [Chryseobacterium sp. Leaf180]|jgi:uncharacterized protein YegP (UPF0339 family)|uniref:YegP family protein n=1 Tax=Chryseobacterium sp. Leaf180 TaxID=1736289 RepID=UPI0006F8B682|nr:DUF1508 domain-containing protein [Chryseobacterium sp. Leaf180]KQR95145.1 hypothetical protein ASG01_04640 [Chryseobacterium sp. Leaf180]